MEIPFDSMMEFFAGKTRAQSRRTRKPIVFEDLPEDINGLYNWLTGKILIDNSIRRAAEAGVPDRYSKTLRHEDTHAELGELARLWMNFAGAPSEPEKDMFLRHYPQSLMHNEEALAQLNTQPTDLADTTIDHLVGLLGRMPSFIQNKTTQRAVTQAKQEQVTRKGIKESIQNQPMTPEVLEQIMKRFGR